MQIPRESTRAGSRKPKPEAEPPKLASLFHPQERELQSPCSPSPPAVTDQSAHGSLPLAEALDEVAEVGPAIADPPVQHGGAEATAAPSPLFLNPSGPVEGSAAYVAGPAEVAPSNPPPLSADPLSDATDLVWYVRPPSGGQYGPATSPIMRAWIDEGRVPPDALVWREGWRDWRQASTVFFELRTDEETDLLAAISHKSPSLSSGQAASFPGGRSRSKSPSTTWIVVLIVAAILLLAAFLWILFKGPRPTAMAPVVPLTAGVAAAADRWLLNFGNRKPRREQR